MDVNLSEEEQVEALKKWWKENGKSLIGGVVLGLGLVFGWRAWVEHNQTVAAQASFQYEQLNNAVAAGSYESAIKIAEQLITEYADSTYAVFAALNMAKVKLEQGDKPGARIDLKWAMDHSKDEGLKQIASIRLARVMLDEKDIDAASAIIGQMPANAFSGELAELKGDIALAQGNTEAARQSYEQAITSLDSNTAVIQMKLDDLAIASTKP